MRKFLIKIVLFISILAFATYSINQVYIIRDKNDYRHIKKFESIPEDIQICNLGSSHGLFGYNYEDLEGKVTCFNFALESQSLSYDARILEYYKDRLISGGTVYITISYFSFFGVKEQDTQQFKEKNARYYKVLPKKLIKEYDYKEDFLMEYPVLTSYLGVFHTLFGKSVDVMEQRWGEETAYMLDVKESAEGAWERHFVIDKLDDERNRIVNDEEISALYDIIKICRESGCTPILVTTPYLAEYTETVLSKSKGFIEDFNKIIKKIKEKTGIQYMDYSNDIRFSDEYSLFMNADHLNKEGARKFTDILIKETIENVK